MNAIKTARNIINEFESCKLIVYLDPVGIPTVGWGTVVTPAMGLEVGDAIIQDLADKWRDDKIASIVKFLNGVVTHPMSDGHKAAFISLIYNIGEGAFHRSTMLKHFNAGNVEEAALQFKRWVFAGGKKLRGLARRRTAEEAIFSDKPSPFRA